jgi:hypothetical protein
MRNNSNLISEAKVYAANQYSEFTTTFRIPFKEGNVESNPHMWKDILGSWSSVCISALQERMQSCIAMLYRNMDNIISSNANRVVFKKNNGHIHCFNYASFEAMKRMVVNLDKGDWNIIRNDLLGNRQLLKALYWIPDSEKADHGGFGFGQLISCLEELAF